MLQPTPEGKAVWKATVISDTGWSHNFTLLRLAPALIWEANEQPAAFAGTVEIEVMTDEPDSVSPDVSELMSASTAQPTAPGPASSMPAATSAADAMDELIFLMEPSRTPESEPPVQPARLSVPANVQPPSPKSEPVPTATPTPPDAHATPSAEHFMAWLKHALATRKLILNDAKALVHTVDGTVYFVTPGIFQRCAKEHPQIAALAKQGDQRLAMAAKTLREIGPALQAPNRPEHLDMRSHRPQKIPSSTWPFGKHRRHIVAWIHLPTTLTYHFYSDMADRRPENL